MYSLTWFNYSTVYLLSLNNSYLIVGSIILHEMSQLSTGRPHPVAWSPDAAPRLLAVRPAVIPVLEASFTILGGRRDSAVLFEPWLWVKFTKAKTLVFTFRKFQWLSDWTKSHRFGQRWCLCRWSLVANAPRKQLPWRFCHGPIPI